MKPKAAFYWCASCGGCDEAILDLAEELLEVTRSVDIVFWPCAIDIKTSDVEAMPDESILATLLNGAIRTSEQEAMAKLLRRKSRYVIAYGACAHLGGVPSLANQFSREQIIRQIYEQCPTVVNPLGARPLWNVPRNEAEVQLPEFSRGVRALDQVVAVDYYVPGCPPTAKLTRTVLGALLTGKLPETDRVLAPDIALCDQCPRKPSKPVELAISEFKRPHEIMLDPKICFLAQGVVCAGPATRSGCDSACVRGNMPCSGCFGPTSRVRDQGAKILSAISGGIAARTESEIERVFQGIPDPVGTFYRYGLAKSLIGGRVFEAEEKDQSHDANS